MTFALQSGPKKKTIIAVFQDFIMKRIKYHTFEVFFAVPGRVRVQPNIVLAMTEVCRAMPLEFSGVIRGLGLVSIIYLLCLIFVTKYEPVDEMIHHYTMDKLDTQVAFQSCTSFQG